jgi:outer membrane protein OmpA-like peptidoglycan-associated protein
MKNLSAVATDFSPQKITYCGLKSAMTSVCLFFLFCCFQGKAQTEKDAINLLNNKQYQQAIQSFELLAKKEPKNPIPYFGIAKAYYDQKQNLKKSQPLATFKYRNFQPQLDLLAQAYLYAQKASANFANMTTTQKETFKAFSVSESQMQGSFAVTIENEAFSILNTLPYRNPFEQIYNSQIYNKEADADTLLALRDALHDQCNQFLATYKNSANAKTVTQIRKDLFTEMLNATTARRYGDKGGKIYEQHCDLILKYYSKTELADILTTFYGYEYSPEEMQKLQHLADSEKITILDLLCKINLHFKGCGTDNKALYDKFIRSLAPADAAFIALQRMAAPAMQQKKWAEASTIFKTYQNLFPDNRIAKLLEVLNLPNDEIALTNLGKAVNSNLQDYSPVLAYNGTLYFARRTENMGEEVYVANPKANVLGSEKIDKNAVLEFENAQPVGKVNTKSHEIPLSVSVDGKTLVLFGNYSGLPDFFYVLKTEKRLGKGDIYYVNKKGNNFDKVEVFPYPVNSEDYEADLSITPDNQAVLFCSDRKGNIGSYLPNYPENGLYYHGSGEFNTDIWVAVRNENGGFNEAINLGNTINTPFAEKKPFLHPDGKTLYFCSEGHHGFGGYDIFMSKRLDENSWTSWSQPVNLGKIINSPADDSFYISTNGEVAFVVSDKAAQGNGKLDIYQMTVPQRFRPEPVTAIAGTVTDDSGKPTSAKIYWQPLPYSTDGKIVNQNTNQSTSQNTNKTPKNGGNIDTDENGKFYFIVPQSRSYTYYAEKEGYFGGGVNVNVTNTQNNDNDNKNKIATKNIGESKANNSQNLINSSDISLSSIDKNNKNRKPFVMRTLNFDHNSDIIRQESFFDLLRLAALLKENKDLKISIEGHTDNAGTHDFNIDLSQRRANAVLAFLAKNGADKAKLTAKGFGEMVAVADNKTEIGKEKNRRVEFKVVE